jgi:hypothetical protein
MIQIGTICISEPMIPSEYEIAKYSLSVMECNIRRMKYMMDLGYFCKEYSEDEWQKFKEVEDMLRNRHPNIDYHTRSSFLGSGDKELGAAHNCK